MKTNRRWLISVLKEAQKTDHKMPWASGSRRDDWNARCAARALGKFKVSA